MESFEVRTPQDIYEEEVRLASAKLGEKFAKILMSEAIRKFVLNCLIKMERQYNDRRI